MNELLKCPFCNAEAKLICHPEWIGDKPIVINFYVTCKDCYAEGTTFDTNMNQDIRESIENAISAWNKRHE